MRDTCGSSNPYSTLHCALCNARLPWADALDEARRQALEEGRRAAFDAGLRQAFEDGKRQALEAGRQQAVPRAGVTLVAAPAHPTAASASPAVSTPSVKPASLSLSPLSVNGLSVLGGMVACLCGLGVLCVTLNETGLRPVLTGEAVFLLSAAWVYFDATNLLVQQGDLVGGFDHSPVGWALDCVVLWPIAFPAYLTARPLYQEMADEPQFRSAALTVVHNSREQPRSVLRLALAAQLTVLLVLCLPPSVTGWNFVWSPVRWRLPNGFRWPSEFDLPAAFHDMARPAPVAEAQSQAAAPPVADTRAAVVRHLSGKLHSIGQFRGSGTRDTASPFTIRSGESPGRPILARPVPCRSKSKSGIPTVHCAIWPPIRLAPVSTPP